MTARSVGRETPRSLASRRSDGNASPTCSSSRTRACLLPRPLVCAVEVINALRAVTVQTGQVLVKTTFPQVFGGGDRCFENRVPNQDRRCPRLHRGPRPRRARGAARHPPRGV